jgi:PAS domain S-box-containing protein
MTGALRKLGHWQGLYISIVALLFLYLGGKADYLLFHTLIELATIAIAACAFIIAWNGQKLHSNSYLLVLGLGFGSVAVLTLAHTLVYKGMKIIPQADLTLSTQLWIASRGVLALALLVAPLAMGRKLRRSVVLYCYIILTALLFGSIFVWRIFPVTFIEGQGVTLFKTLAEYVICLILAAGLVLLWRRRAAFDRRVVNYLGVGIIFTIAAELAFSSYFDLTGLSNVIGHLLTLIAFSYFYLAIVRTGFSQPLQLLFRDLKEREEELRLSEEQLLRANELLEAATKGAAVMIATLDCDLRYTYFNKTYRQEMKRLSGRELQLGQSLMEIFAYLPEQQKEAVERWRRTLQGGSANYTIEFGDPGYRRVYSVMHTPLRDVEGEIVGAGEVGHDITEQVRAEEALRVSEERYRSLFNSMSEGFALHEIICDAEGEPCDYRFLEINPAFERLTGLSREQTIGRTHNEVLPGDDPYWAKAYGAVALTGEPAQFENYSTALEKHYEVFAYRPAPRQFAVIFRDITERKRMESEREMTVEFLHLVNDNRAVASLLRRAADFFQEHCRCEAIGIRLKAGADYPYFETRGFSDAFVKAESPLCARAADGKILRDEAFNPVLDCLCGKVVSGRFGPPQACFTERGSFWTNSTSKLIASAEAETLGPLRNRCNLEGYESVALIALHSGEAYLGLLQLNDRRPGCFSPEIIALWERLSGYLAVALAKAQAEEALRDSEERFKVIASSTPDHVLVQDRELRYSLVVNPQMGLTEEDMIGKTDFDFLGREDAERLTQIKRRVIETGEALHLELPLVSRQGDMEYFEGDYVPKYNVAGEIDGLIGYFRNITERKRAEAQMVWLASFPRQNLSPIVEIESNGKLVYANLVAQQLLPDIREQGLGHPWLAGLEEVAHEFREEGAVRATRDVQIGDSWYEQVLIPVENGRRIRIYANDITERKRSGEALLQERNRMRLLADTAAQLLAAPDPLGAVNEICREVMQFLDCRMFFVFLDDEKTGRIHLDAYEGIPAAAAREIEWMDHGTVFCGCAVREGGAIGAEPVSAVVGDSVSEPAKSLGAKAFACHPIKFGERVMGTLSFGCTLRESFSEAELSLMRIITDQVALAVVRKRSEQKLLEAERGRAQLAEALVSEIGHRTKNNLAIVSGLLQMQMDQEGEKISGPELIREAVTRILSFAALHEQMYQSRADSIELVDALKRIAEIDRQALSAGDVTISVEGKAMNYPSGVGTTLCVVANELLTNALKHGGRQSGERRVEARVVLADGALTISVWNSGDTLGKDFDIRKRSRTGLGLVHTIVVDQYGGSFTLAPDHEGTLARIVLSDARLCAGP